MIMKFKEQLKEFFAFLIYNRRSSVSLPRPIEAISLRQPSIPTRFHAWTRAIAFVVICIFIPDQVSWAFNYNPAILYGTPVVQVQLQPAQQTAMLVSSSMEHLLTQVAGQPSSRIDLKIDDGKNLLSGNKHREYVLAVDSHVNFTPAQIRQTVAWLAKPSLHHLNCGVYALNDILAAQGIHKTPEEVSLMTVTVDIISGIVKPGDKTLKTSLAALSRVAKAFDLKYAAAKLKPSDVLKLPPPFIASLAGEHFVTVIAVDGGMVRVMDIGTPAAMPRAQFEQRATGFVLAQGLEAFDTAAFTRVPEAMQAFVWGDHWRNRSSDLPGLVTLGQIALQVGIQIGATLLLGGNCFDAAFALGASQFSQAVGSACYVTGNCSAKTAFILTTALNAALTYGYNYAQGAAKAGQNPAMDEIKSTATALGEDLTSAGLQTALENAATQTVALSVGEIAKAAATGAIVGAVRGLAMYEVSKWLDHVWGDNQAIAKSFCYAVASSVIDYGTNVAASQIVAALSSPSTTNSRSSIKDSSSSAEKRPAMSFSEFMNPKTILNPEGKALSPKDAFTSAGFRKAVIGDAISAVVRYAANGFREENDKDANARSQVLGLFGKQMGGMVGNWVGVSPFSQAEEKFMQANLKAAAALKAGENATPEQKNLLINLSSEDARTLGALVQKQENEAAPFFKTVGQAAVTTLITLAVTSDQKNLSHNEQAAQAQRNMIVFEASAILSGALLAGADALFSPGKDIEESAKARGFVGYSSNFSGQDPAQPSFNFNDTNTGRSSAYGIANTSDAYDPNVGISLSPLSRFMNATTQEFWDSNQKFQADFWGTSAMSTFADTRREAPERMAAASLAISTLDQITGFTPEWALSMKKQWDTLQVDNAKMAVTHAKDPLQPGALAGDVLYAQLLATTFDSIDPGMISSSYIASMAQKGIVSNTQRGFENVASGYLASVQSDSLARKIYTNLGFTYRAFAQLEALPEANRPVQVDNVSGLMNQDGQGVLDTKAITRNRFRSLNSGNPYYLVTLTDDNVGGGTAFTAQNPVTNVQYQGSWQRDAAGHATQFQVSGGRTGGVSGLARIVGLAEDVGDFNLSYTKDFTGKTLDRGQIVAMTPEGKKDVLLLDGLNTSFYGFSRGRAPVIGEATYAKTGIVLGGKEVTTTTWVPRSSSNVLVTNPETTSFEDFHLGTSADRKTGLGSPLAYGTVLGDTSSGSPLWNTGTAQDQNTGSSITVANSWQQHLNDSLKGNYIKTPELEYARGELYTMGDSREIQALPKQFASPLLPNGEGEPVLNNTVAQRQLMPDSFGALYGYAQLNPGVLGLDTDGRWSLNGQTAGAGASYVNLSYAKNGNPLVEAFAAKDLVGYNNDGTQKFQEKGQLAFLAESNIQATKGVFEYLDTAGRVGDERFARNLILDTTNGKPEVYTRPFKVADASHGNIQSGQPVMGYLDGAKIEEIYQDEHNGFKGEGVARGDVSFGAVNSVGTDISKSYFNENSGWTMSPLVEGRGNGTIEGVKGEKWDFDGKPVELSTKELNVAFKVRQKDGVYLPGLELLFTAKDKSEDITFYSESLLGAKSDSKKSGTMGSIKDPQSTLKLYDQKSYGTEGDQNNPVRKVFLYKKSGHGSTEFNGQVAFTADDPFSGQMTPLLTSVHYIYSGEFNEKTQQFNKTPYHLDPTTNLVFSPKLYRGFGAKDIHLHITDTGSLYVGDRTWYEQNLTTGNKLTHASIFRTGQYWGGIQRLAAELSQGYNGDPGKDGEIGKEQAVKIMLSPAAVKRGLYMDVNSRNGLDKYISVSGKIRQANGAWINMASFTWIGKGLDLKLRTENKPKESLTWDPRDNSPLNKKDGAGSGTATEPNIWAFSPQGIRTYTSQELDRLGMNQQIILATTGFREGVLTEGKKFDAAISHYIYGNTFLEGEKGYAYQTKHIKGLYNEGGVDPEGQLNTYQQALNNSYFEFTKSANDPFMHFNPNAASVVVMDGLSTTNLVNSRQTSHIQTPGGGVVTLDSFQKFGSDMPGAFMGVINMPNGSRSFFGLDHMIVNNINNKQSGSTLMNIGGGASISGAFPAQQTPFTGIWMHYNLNMTGWSRVNKDGSVVFGGDLPQGLTGLVVTGNIQTAFQRKLYNAQVNGWGMNSLGGASMMIDGQIVVPANDKITGSGKGEVLARGNVASMKEDVMLVNATKMPLVYQGVGQFWSLLQPLTLTESGTGSKRVTTHYFDGNVTYDVTAGKDGEDKYNIVKVNGKQWKQEDSLTAEPIAGRYLVKKDGWELKIIDLYNTKNVRSVRNFEEVTLNSNDFTGKEFDATSRTKISKKFDFGDVLSLFSNPVTNFSMYLNPYVLGEKIVNKLIFNEEVSTEVILKKKDTTGKIVQAGSVEFGKYDPNTGRPQVVQVRQLDIKTLRPKEATDFQGIKEGIAGFIVPFEKVLKIGGIFKRVEGVSGLSRNRVFSADNTRAIPSNLENISTKIFLNKNGTIDFGASLKNTVPYDQVFKPIEYTTLAMNLQNRMSARTQAVWSLDYSTGTMQSVANGSTIKMPDGYYYQVNNKDLNLKKEGELNTPFTTAVLGQTTGVGRWLKDNQMSAIAGVVDPGRWTTFDVVSTPFLFLAATKAVSMGTRSISGAGAMTKWLVPVGRAIAADFAAGTVVSVGQDLLTGNPVSYDRAVANGLSWGRTGGQFQLAFGATAMGATALGMERWGAALAKTAEGTGAKAFGARLMLNPAKISGVQMGIINTFNGYLESTMPGEKAWTWRRGIVDFVVGDVIGSVYGGLKGLKINGGEFKGMNKAYHEFVLNPENVVAHRISNAIAYTGGSLMGGQFRDYYGQSSQHVDNNGLQKTILRVTAGALGGSMFATSGKWLNFIVAENKVELTPVLNSTEKMTVKLGEKIKNFETVKSLGNEWKVLREEGALLRPGPLQVAGVRPSSLAQWWSGAPRAAYVRHALVGGSIGGGFSMFDDVMTGRDINWEKAGGYALFGAANALAMKGWRDVGMLKARAVLGISEERVSLQAFARNPDLIWKTGLISGADFAWTMPAFNGATAGIEYLLNKAKYSLGIVGGKPDKENWSEARKAVFGPTGKEGLWNASIASMASGFKMGMTLGPMLGVTSRPFGISGGGPLEMVLSHPWAHTIPTTASKLAVVKAGLTSLGVDRDTADAIAFYSLAFFPGANPGAARDAQHKNIEKEIAWREGRDQSDPKIFDLQKQQMGLLQQEHREVKQQMASFSDAKESPVYAKLEAKSSVLDARINEAGAHMAEPIIRERIDKIDNLIDKFQQRFDSVSNDPVKAPKIGEILSKLEARKGVLTALLPENITRLNASIDTAQKLVKNMEAISSKKDAPVNKELTDLIAERAQLLMDLINFKAVVRIEAPNSDVSKKSPQVVSEQPTVNGLLDGLQKISKDPVDLAKELSAKQARLVEVNESLVLTRQAQIARAAAKTPDQKTLAIKDYQAAKADADLKRVDAERILALHELNAKVEKAKQAGIDVEKISAPGNKDVSRQAGPEYEEVVRAQRNVERLEQEKGDAVARAEHYQGRALAERKIQADSAQIVQLQAKRNTLESKNKKTDVELKAINDLDVEITGKEKVLRWFTQLVQESVSHDLAGGASEGKNNITREMARDWKEIQNTKVLRDLAQQYVKSKGVGAEESTMIEGVIKELTPLLDSAFDQVRPQVGQEHAAQAPPKTQDTGSANESSSRMRISSETSDFSPTETQSFLKELSSSITQISQRRAELAEDMMDLVVNKYGNAAKVVRLKAPERQAKAELDAAKNDLGEIRQSVPVKTSLEEKVTTAREVEGKKNSKSQNTKDSVSSEENTDKDSTKNIKKAVSPEDAILYTLQEILKNESYVKMQEQMKASPKAKAKARELLGERAYGEFVSSLEAKAKQEEAQLNRISDLQAKVDVATANLDNTRWSGLVENYLKKEYSQLSKEDRATLHFGADEILMNTILQQFPKQVAEWKALKEEREKEKDANASLIDQRIHEAEKALMVEVGKQLTRDQIAATEWFVRSGVKQLENLWAQKDLSEQKKTENSAKTEDSSKTLIDDMVALVKDPGQQEVVRSLFMAAQMERNGSAMHQNDIKLEEKKLDNEGARKDVSKGRIELLKQNIEAIKTDINKYKDPTGLLSLYSGILERLVGQEYDFQREPDTADKHRDSAVEHLERAKQESSYAVRLEAMRELADQPLDGYMAKFQQATTYRDQRAALQGMVTEGIREQAAVDIFRIRQELQNSINSVLSSPLDNEERAAKRIEKISERLQSLYQRLESLDPGSDVVIMEKEDCQKLLALARDAVQIIQNPAGIGSTRWDGIKDQAKKFGYDEKPNEQKEMREKAREILTSLHKTLGQDQAGLFAARLTDRTRQESMLSGVDHDAKVQRKELNEKDASSLAILIDNAEAVDKERGKTPAPQLQGRHQKLYDYTDTILRGLKEKENWDRRPDQIKYVFHQLNYIFYLIDRIEEKKANGVVWGIDGVLLSLAMAGGKTKMEPYIINLITPYAREHGVEVMNIKPNVTLAEAAGNREGFFRYKVPGDLTLPENKGKVPVLAFQELQKISLDYQNSRDPDKVNPLKDYLGVVDEIHQILLSVPMITSDATDSFAVARKMTTEKLMERAREQITGRMLGQTILEVANAFAGKKSDAMALVIDAFIKEERSGDIKFRTSEEKKFIWMRDGEVIDVKNVESGDKLFEVKDGKIVLMDREVSSEEMSKASGIQDIFKEQFRNKMKNDAKAFAELADGRWDIFMDAAATALKNELWKDKFRAAFKADGTFDLVTIQHILSGTEAYDRVFTDKTGLNSFMRMIVGLHEAKTNKTVSLPEFIRLTDRNNHVQVTAMETLGLMGSWLGVTGTAEPVHDLAKAYGIYMHEFGTAITLEHVNWTHELVKGAPGEDIATQVRAWLRAPRDPNRPASTEVLYINQGLTEDRKAAIDHQDIQALKNDKNVVVLHYDANNFNQGVEALKRKVGKDIKGNYYDVNRVEMTDAFGRKVEGGLDGKKIIFLSAGQEGASFEFDGHLTHYDFNVRALYGALQSMLRGDSIKSEYTEIKDNANRTSSDYKLFVNIGAYRDPRLIDPDRDRLRSVQGTAEEFKVLVQIMKRLQQEESQQSFVQSVSVDKGLNRDAMGQHLQRMYEDWRADMVREFAQENGIARIWDGVNGAGGQALRMSQDGKNVMHLYDFTLQNGQGIKDEFGYIKLAPGQIGVPTGGSGETMRVYTPTTDMSQQTIMDRLNRGEAIEQPTQQWLVMDYRVNPDTASDKPPMVRTWVPAEQVVNGEDVEVKVTTDMMVVVADGNKVKVPQVTRYFKNDLYKGMDQFKRIEKEDLVRIGAALGLGKAESLELVTPVSGTKQGYKYQAFYDAQQNVRGVLFEGVLYQNSIKEEMKESALKNNNLFEFEALVSEKIEHADMRRDELRLKLKMKMQGPELVMADAEVANEAPILLNGREIAKGDKVGYYNEEGGKKMFVVHGKGVVIRDGHSYIAQDGVVATDIANVKVAYKGEDGKIKVARAFGQESMKFASLEEGYQRGLFKIMGGVPEGAEAGAGLDLKGATIDNTTGEMVSRNMSRIGWFWDDRIFVRQWDAAKNGYYYNFEDNAAIKDKAESLNMTLVKHAYGYSVAAEEFESAMAEQVRVGEKLTRDYQSFLATQGASRQQAMDYAASVNQYANLFRVKASVIPMTEKGTPVNKDATLGQIAHQSGMRYAVQLESMDETPETPEGVPLGKRAASFGQIVGFIKKEFNKDLLLDPALDAAKSAAQSTEDHFKLGSALGLSLIKGLVKFDEAGVFLHELFHEYNKVMKGRGQGGAFVQSRLTRYDLIGRLLGQGEDIYWEQFSNEEIFAHYLEMFGMKFKPDGKPEIPEFLKDVLHKDFTEFLEKANKVLPGFVFKGKMQFLHEAYEAGDIREARDHARAITETIARMTRFAQASEFSFRQAIKVVESTQDIASFVTENTKNVVVTIPYTVQGEKNTQEVYISADIPAAERKAEVLKILKSSAQQSAKMSRRSALLGMISQKHPAETVQLTQMVDQYLSGLTDAAYIERADRLMKVMGCAVIDVEKEGDVMKRVVARTAYIDPKIVAQRQKDYPEEKKDDIEKELREVGNIALQPDRTWKINLPDEKKAEEVSIDWIRFNAVQSRIGASLNGTTATWTTPAMQFVDNKDKFVKNIAPHVPKGYTVTPVGHQDGDLIKDLVARYQKKNPDTKKADEIRDLLSSSDALNLVVRDAKGDIVGYLAASQSGKEGTLAVAHFEADSYKAQEALKAVVAQWKVQTDNNTRYLPGAVVVTLPLFAAKGGASMIAYQEVVKNSNAEVLEKAMDNITEGQAESRWLTRQGERLQEVLNTLAKLAVAGASAEHLKQVVAVVGDGKQGPFMARIHLPDEDIFVPLPDEFTQKTPVDAFLTAALVPVIERACLEFARQTLVIQAGQNLTDPRVHAAAKNAMDRPEYWDDPLKLKALGLIFAETDQRPQENSDGTFIYTDKKKDKVPENSVKISAEGTISLLTYKEKILPVALEDEERIRVQMAAVAAFAGAVPADAKAGELFPLSKGRKLLTKFNFGAGKGSEESKNITDKVIDALEKQRSGESVGGEKLLRDGIGEQQVLIDGIEKSRKTVSGDIYYYLAILQEGLADTLAQKRKHKSKEIMERAVSGEDKQQLAVEWMSLEQESELKEMSWSVRENLVKAATDVVTQPDIRQQAVERICHFMAADHSQAVDHGEAGTDSWFEWVENFFRKGVLGNAMKAAASAEPAASPALILPVVPKPTLPVAPSWYSLQPFVQPAIRTITTITQIPTPQMLEDFLSSNTPSDPQARQRFFEVADVLLRNRGIDTGRLDAGRAQAVVRASLAQLLTLTNLQLKRLRDIKTAFDSENPTEEQIGLLKRYSMLTAVLGGEDISSPEDQDQFGSSFRTSATSAKKLKCGIQLVDMDDPVWFAFYLKKYTNDPLMLLGTIVAGARKSIVKNALKADLDKAITVLAKLAGREDDVTKLVRDIIKEVPSILERLPVVQEVLTIALGKAGAAKVMAALHSSFGYGVVNAGDLVIKHLNPAVKTMLRRYRHKKLTREKFVEYLAKWEYALNEKGQVVYQSEAVAERERRMVAPDDEALAIKLESRKLIGEYRRREIKVKQLQAELLKLSRSIRDVEPTAQEKAVFNARYWWLDPDHKVPEDLVKPGNPLDAKPPEPVFIHRPVSAAEDNGSTFENETDSKLRLIDDPGEIVTDRPSPADSKTAIIPPSAPSIWKTNETPAWAPVLLDDPLLLKPRFPWIMGGSAKPAVSFQDSRLPAKSKDGAVDTL